MLALPSHVGCVSFEVIENVIENVADRLIIMTYYLCAIVCVALSCSIFELFDVE